jgi:hypothetical protein
MIAGDPELFNSERCNALLTRFVGYVRTTICNVGQEIAEGKIKRAAAGICFNH